MQQPAQTRPGTGWAWKVYAAVFAVSIIAYLASLLSPYSFLYIYYHVLIAFNDRYSTLYILAIISSVVNILNLVPLFLYVFRISWQPALIWRVLFILRVASDLAGHSYEFKTIQSMLLTDFLLGLVALFPLGSFLIPSYIAGFKYAFMHTEIFSQPHPGKQKPSR